MADALNKIRQKHSQFKDSGEPSLPANAPQIKPFEGICFKINAATEECDMRVIGTPLPRQKKNSECKLSDLKDGLQVEIRKRRDESLLRRQELYNIDNEDVGQGSEHSACSSSINLYSDNEGDNSDNEDVSSDSEYVISDNECANSVNECVSSDAEGVASDHVNSVNQCVNSDAESVNSEAESVNSDNDDYNGKWDSEEEHVISDNEGDIPNNECVISENEAEVEETTIGRRRNRIEDFVENEAALSGSDSGDECEGDNLDEYDSDGIDDLQVDEDRLHNQLMQINNKMVADDNEEAITLIKDRFFPDGDVSDTLRLKNFRWRQTDTTAFEGDKESDSDEGGDEETDTQWRIKRFARETYMRGQGVEETAMVTNSSQLSSSSPLKRRVRGSFLERTGKSAGWLDGLRENSNSGALTNPTPVESGKGSSKRLRSAGNDGFFSCFSRNK